MTDHESTESEFDEEKHPRPTLRSRGGMVTDGKYVRTAWGQEKLDD